MNFNEKKTFWIFVQMSLQVVRKSQIDNKSSLPRTRINDDTDL